MSLHDTIASDAASVFCNADDFAESVIYTSGSTGDARTISAVVRREAWETQPGTNSETPVFEVHVVNSATLGILSSQIAPGKDTLTFAARVSETPTARVILRITSHDEGMLTLECR